MILYTTVYSQVRQGRLLRSSHHRWVSLSSTPTLTHPDFETKHARSTLILSTFVRMQWTSCNALQRPTCLSYSMSVGCSGFSSASLPKIEEEKLRRTQKELEVKNALAGYLLKPHTATRPRGTLFNFTHQARLYADAKYTNMSGPVGRYGRPAYHACTASDRAVRGLLYGKIHHGCALHVQHC